jgi:hypothetical protein
VLNTPLGALMAMGWCELIDGWGEARRIVAGPDDGPEADP